MDWRAYLDELGIAETDRMIVTETPIWIGSTRSSRRRPLRRYATTCGAAALELLQQPRPGAGETAFTFFQALGGHR